MADQSKAISTLNTLIATTIDSITGYEDSAQNIDSQRFREIFRQRANERQDIVEQLRAEVRRLGGKPEDGGSFLGKAHQRFEDLKAAIRHFYESEKPTAIYCHGTAALVDLKLSDGSYLVDGETLTGFAPTPTPRHNEVHGVHADTKPRDHRTIS